MPLEIDSIVQAITRCKKCSRLIKYCRHVGEIKKKEFRDWDYWAKPVPGFGDPKAWLWIVGLAPAAHGANRTGRMFTGDSSGHWLYRALHRVGLANQPESTSQQDGLKLNGVFISSAARCAPPDNKPTPKELKNCETFLIEERETLKRVRVILMLGAIAQRAVFQLFGEIGNPLPKPWPKFCHGGTAEWGPYQLLSSYHPSRQNTQTGRLTLSQWNSIFDRAIQLNG